MWDIMSLPSCLITLQQKQHPQHHALLSLTGSNNNNNNNNSKSSKRWGKWNHLHVSVLIAGDHGIVNVDASTNINYTNGTACCTATRMTATIKSLGVPFETNTGCQRHLLERFKWTPYLKLVPDKQQPTREVRQTTYGNQAGQAREEH